MHNPVFYVLTAFFLGSLPFGHWLALVRGIDLRNQGSGNTGATNVGRVLGKKWGIFVFVLDLGKGWIAVALAKSVGNLPETWSVTVGVFAVLGHVFSPWLGFRGGKGVATSAGILIGLAPWVALGVALIWFLTFQMSRTVSVASLCAATAFPLFVFLALTTIVFFFQGSSTSCYYPALFVGSVRCVWRRLRDLSLQRDGLRS